MKADWGDQMSPVEWCGVRNVVRSQGERSWPGLARTEAEAPGQSLLSRGVRRAPGNLVKERGFVMAQADTSQAMLLVLEAPGALLSLFP